MQLNKHSVYHPILRTKPISLGQASPTLSIIAIIAIIAIMASMVQDPQLHPTSSTHVTVSAGKCTSLTQSRFPGGMPIRENLIMQQYYTFGTSESATVASYRSRFRPANSPLFVSGMWAVQTANQSVRMEPRFRCSRGERP